MLKFSVTLKENTNCQKRHIVGFKVMVCDFFLLNMCKYKVEDWVGATELILKLKPTDYECTFSRGKAEPRPLPRGVHGDGSGIAFPILLGLKFGQVLFFLGRGVENWCYFLGYIKLQPQ